MLDIKIFRNVPSGFHALEWVSDPTIKKKDTKDFEEEVEKAVGEDEKRFATKVGI